ncbi:tetratricopeptide repeat protein [Taibaiella chishuiensis]|uniref:Tetratricopeptide repeat protein n=1 Tax=Taibaiella chishuiensis TaxID=1434707 RepID=A0A2P8DD76_9BACT|nr:hypothetical protein [Taibaiella chishuiensis]PSK95162.1 tetratricopeptide repeat protein [Taibaiella chishuiensis]
MKRVINFISAVSVLVLLLWSSQHVYAQQSDSLKAAQKRIQDSTKAAQQKRTDSLTFIRNYKQSKHYQDSVEIARQKRVNAMKASQQSAADSLLIVRKRVSDSIMNIRRRYSDSIKNYNDSVRTALKVQIERQKIERQRASDSIAALRAYRESKHYKDSVTVARQKIKDAAAAIRKHNSDSMRAAQKRITDSTFAIRKAFNDSLKTALEANKALRKVQLDSMAAVRKSRADSLGKVREARAELRKQKAAEKEKAKKDKMNLALELKIKKKQDKYTNEDMRKKSWSLPRKVIQNTFTRYNYYFNADKKMDEAVENMVRSNTDNYDSLLALFPFDPDRDSMKLMSDMDTIIRKSSVGIQIHDPRAKWQDNLYLLVGQAYYYKGDYQNAGSAFKLIVAQAEADKREQEKKSGKPKTKEDRNKPITYSEAEKTGIAGMLEHKSSKNEAMLWLSRTLAQSRKEGQAQTLLDMLRNDAAFPARLKGRLALEQAFIDLRRGDAARAAQSLAVVSTDKDMPDWIRMRSGYLNGQLQQQLLNYNESSNSFKGVIALNPNLEMDFYARKNIAVNSLYNGNNSIDATDMLAKMAADGKYRPYYDQIYYAMGKAALKNKQSDKALEHFKKSVALSQSNKKQKGLSFAALGDEYYKLSNYNSAKRSYDSAAMFLTAAQEPVYSLAIQRAQALDKIAVPGTEVREQDSLLRLASLSEKEQRGVIRDYIKALERQQADSTFRAMNGLNNNTNTAMNTMGNNPGTQAWYFANPNLMKTGENDFKQRWGNRPLKDNWRRSGFSASGFDADGGDAESGAVTQSNLPDEDSLYAAIPHTPEAQQKARSRVEEGLFSLGKAYYTYLEDYGNAVKTFDTLERRFPEHKHQAEVLYTRYLMAMRQNHPSAAQELNNTLQSRYPDSEWARLLKGAAASREDDKHSAWANASTSGQTISGHYDETYNLLMQRQYNDVLNRVDEADKTFKDQGAYKKKYTLMKAIAVAGMGRYPEADTMLRQFIASNPNDSLTGWANTVLDYIGKNKPAVTQAPPAAGVQPSVPATNAADTAAAAQYTYQPGGVHYVILSGQQDARFSGLKSGLSDYNLMKEGNGALTVTMTSLDAGRSLIICKEFPTAAAARKYVNEIRNVKLLFREYNNPADYDILLISADNFPKLFMKKDYARYKAFYSKNYK